MWYTQDVQSVLKETKTNREKGLTEEEVKNRLQKNGKNQLEDKKKEPIWIRFLKQFNDFMIIILILASLISAMVAKWQGSHDYFDSIIIIGIVIFNAILGMIQESKAEKSLEELKKMSAPMAKVKREGKVCMVPSEDIVVGDLVLLEAGSLVPADCRVIKSANLQVEESALTGETLPVEKQVDVVLKENTALGDRVNMAYATTIVLKGSGEGIVTNTGMDTYVGKIAHMMMHHETPETPLQRKLGEVGKILGLVCLFICFFIFIIGIFKKIPPIEMFMTSVGLAVAAIPEGLPAIVTIVLSIGVTKMARKNAIIRKLPAVETLGSSSVICSDKTGTLTQNKMQVMQVKGLQPDDKIEEKILELGSMCTDSYVGKEGEKNVSYGDPTEIAILQKTKEQGKTKEAFYEKMPRVGEIPFDSSRKLMTTIHQISKEKWRIITKGAPDVLIKRCQYGYQNGKIESKNKEMERKIKKQNETMATQALRVIGVSYKDVNQLPEKWDTDSVEKDLIFVGLIGMMDPPREGVKEAIYNCKRAGIKTVMITGDHVITAKAIAKKIGILEEHDLAITGEEMDTIPESSFEKQINKYAVFARVSPEHKVKIVEAFQKTGAVVAMTGDGVNDAPALKKADIGVAMGKNGTDVAKNAADMVLADDNFVTIVEAVKEGRTIFTNIQKAIHFLIATNIGEIVAIFMGLLLGLKSPLLAIQLLWINLVTDSLPAIALGLEPAEKNVMKRKPVDKKKGIFADGLWGKILVEGMMIGFLTLIAFMLGNAYYGLTVGRTMAFVVLGMAELVHCFNIKSDESILKTGIWENKYLIGAFLVGTLLQVGVVCVQPIADIFKLVPLNRIQWMYVLLLSFAPIAIVEAQKKVNEIKFGKVVYGLDKRGNVK
mgnify:CR=1 FL=1